MEEKKDQQGQHGLSRRKFLKATGVAAAGIGANIIIPSRSPAAKKTLKILQWNHFVPGYDKWFNGTYVKEWGLRNDTQVIVDNIGLAGLNSR
ncbi:MAG: twin-arginine translocation signal domain-containing protein, partial [Candidatus Methylomirabilales bacterium]